MPAKRHSSRESKPAATPFVGAFGALLLFGLGTVTFLFGHRVTVSRYFEFENRFGSSVTIGALGFNDRPEGFRILEGSEAVYWGLAFCALGVMFGLWGTGIILRYLARKRSNPGQASPAGRINTWLSFSCLLAATFCLFPPWRLGSAVFYITSVLVVSAIVISVRRNHPLLPKKVVPGVIIAAILAGNFHLGSVCADILLALAVMFLAGVHFLMLAPHLIKRRPGEKEVVPSFNFDE